MPVDLTLGKVVGARMTYTIRCSECGKQFSEQNLEETAPHLAKLVRENSMDLRTAVENSAIGHWRHSHCPDYVEALRKNRREYEAIHRRFNAIARQKLGLAP